jgi:histone H3/H4
LRHRDAWAEEKRAPSREQWEKQQAEESHVEKASDSAASASVRRVVKPEREPDEPYDVELSERDIPKDILIVASKLKNYIRARSGMNTSESVLRVLSDRVRELTDDAIRKAGQDGRKTVMDRDY